MEDVSNRITAQQLGALINAEKTVHHETESKESIG
jgi:hypothetical protein